MNKALKKLVEGTFEPIRKIKHLLKINSIERFY